MKRFTATALAILLPILLLFGCSPESTGEGGDTSGSGNAEKLSVVCTIFPQYDWVRQILGERAQDFDITLLLDNSIDLHSYNPSVPDIAKISDADLFIYSGGESDEWVDDALKEKKNAGMKIISLLETLGDGAKEEDVLPEMQPEEEEGEEEGEALDEHVWLSVKNAVTLCGAIEAALSEIDSENAAVYKANLDSYTAKLNALDAQYKTDVDAAPVKTVLFGDRFPFRYLVDDYGIKYTAAFPGCSAETEASFETIAKLVKKVNDLNLKAVLVLEDSDKKIAEKIVSDSNAKNQQILVMNAMQSVSRTDAADKTYISIMESNLNTLREALK
jgi:zinc transport system substrate-binding protein